MGIIIVGNDSYRVRRLIIDHSNEPVQIVVGSKSLADKLLAENADIILENINFFINDSLIDLSAEEICKKHLVEPINFVKEIE